uniref:Ig-like domain-containing protein n=1 Tax=Sander lucioperca TaxID=283035 RepID=A0A8C9XUS1_SANLU
RSPLSSVLTFLLLIVVCYCFSDLTVVVQPGDDVILPCQAADSSIRAVKWTRPDLEPDTVLVYRDGHLDPTYQHPSFKDRVELVDRDLKDGNVSLILKNVSSIDNGTYECRVAPAGSKRRKRGIIDSEPIRTVRLQVTEPAAVLVLVAAAVFGVLMYKRRKNKRSGQPADEASADKFINKSQSSKQLTVFSCAVLYTT